MEKQNSNNNNKKGRKKQKMRKSLVWEGNLNKKKNFLDCRTWNEPLENIKKKHKKERLD